MAGPTRALPTLMRLTQGTHRTYTITAQEVDEVSGSVEGPMDLTGAALTFSAKRSIGDDLALITKSVGNGITITDAPGGIASLELLPGDTSGLPDDRLIELVYSLKVTATGGRVSELAHGMVDVDPMVTA